MKLFLIFALKWTRVLHLFRASLKSTKQNIICARLFILQLTKIQNSKLAMKFKTKPIESMRISGLLLHKCWLVRKRQWISSLIGEIFIPVSIIFSAWVVSYYYRTTPFHLDHRNETHYESQSLERLIDLISEEPMEIIYAPSNPFTDKLMTKVVECLKYNANITGLESESTLVAYSVDKSYWSSLLAVIFEEYVDESTKHLNYKIRSKRMLFQHPAMVNYFYNNMPAGQMTSYYTKEGFVQIQICLDQSYIQIMSNETIDDIPQTFIQQIPYPAVTVPTWSLLHGNLLLLTIAFTIPVLIETSKATKEKIVGINFLMSMNGIPNTLNMLSWIVSGLLLLSVLCVTTVLLFIYSPQGYIFCVLYYGNPVILFIVLIFHLSHSMTFCVHLSAYVSKSLFLAFTVIMINFLVLILDYFQLLYVYVYVPPFMGIIFPILLLCQAMDEIYVYESIGIGVQWSNLFVNVNPVKKFGSIGMIVVLSVIGIFFHFWTAIYLNAIKPGKYGIGRHPFFFLMRNKKEKPSNDVKNLTFDDEDNKYFEPSSVKNHTSGIQIRNLKKSYDISLFNKEKVHALRGVSIDFYKGQITSLLGHNGAGKSTLMSILTGVVRPSDGSILINSKNLRDHACEILKDVGFYAQEDMYFPNLAVTEQLEFFAMLKKNNKSKSEIESNITTLIQKLKLLKVKDCLPNKLSEDQKRKLCLGMALVNNPNTLILDEPTSRLDQENKRVIWDILMEMKGQKTIVISTHDMEEADILGDRIAILHEGRLKSCGTSFYLKKMIADQSHIEVTLLIERWSDQDKIRNEFHGEATIVEKQDKKIILNVPITLTLADSLKKIEEKKRELGVTDFKLSHVGLEQVFLKVAENCDSPSEPYAFIANDHVKLMGLQLFMQTFRALLIKKFGYFWKELKTFCIQVFAVLIALLGIFIVFNMTNWIYETEAEVIHIRLDLYDNPYTVYPSSDEIISNQYKQVSEYFSATSLKISDTNLDNGLILRAEEDLIDYRNYLIAAAEFNKTANGSLMVNAFYSEEISFSLPISVNLLSNTIICSLLGPDYSIGISAQILLDSFEPLETIDLTKFISYVAVIIFVIPIYFAIAMFVANPSRESARGLKHLQKMTGISGFTYWATMFLSDLAHFALIVVLLVIGLMCVDHSLDLHLYEITEIGIMILLLMLLAVNVLPLVYCFSFVRAKTSVALKLLIFIPIGIVVGDCVMFIWKNHDLNEENYFLARAVYLLLPYVSFLRGLTNLQTTALLNGMCRRSSDDFYKSWCEYSEGLCCERHCRDRNCQKLIPYFRDEDIDSLKVSVSYLCMTPILYFGILALLESHLIEKLINKFTKYRANKPVVNEQLQIEKSMILQKIQELNKNYRGLNIEELRNDIATKELLLIYELRKYYRKIKAVQDFSLGVNRQECFGLFGANRSGKSTILKMIVGVRIPDYGVMVLGGKDFEKNKKQFLSQIGYCPQYNATLKCLNIHDHLFLFARLRGIPENQVNNEVRFWIERLNLKTCASQQCGTLSSGTSQRLNIAMAMVGKPNLVLLDEPTTRIDPGMRRSFWKTVKSCQTAGQTFLLALHNMEDCEALCKRTATMLDGKLICIGTPEEMKQRFGAGYDVQIRVNSTKVKNQLDRIKKDMRLLLHCVLTSENSSYLMYHVTGVCTTWSKIYEVMNQIKTKYDCVDDFLVVVRLTT